jgi:glycosyltransferase involved in cell wall biosynthesis
MKRSLKRERRTLAEPCGDLYRGPARAGGIRKGWLMVIPSRAESFPYIVLETVAAAKPLLATRVGGIAEVLPEHRLLPPNDAAGLAERIKAGVV